jgi:fatty-acyl-CoA synthase
VPKAAASWGAFLAAGNSMSDAAIRAAAAAVKPDDLLLIQFTSGTTAYPKGVMLTHDNMLRNAWAAGSRIGVRADDRYFNCRPFFHVGGSTLSALVSLVFGACIVTLPTFEAGAALALMIRERCTLISGNDTLFRLGGGRTGDDAQDRGRARHRGDLRRLRPLGSLAERRDERLPRRARASHRGAGAAA